MTRLIILFVSTVSITWWSLLDPTHCLAPPNEAICIRDPKEIEDTTIMKWLPEFDHFENEESHFIELLGHSSVFVDKTLLIKSIIETESKTIIINSPRKSGKTINLHMLKDFFEMRLDRDFSVRPPPQTSTHKFFTTGKLDTTMDRPLQAMYFRRPYKPSCGRYDCSDDGGGETEYHRALTQGDTVKATYTTPPMISKQATIVEEHLAKYPVIHLDLGRTYSDKFVSQTTEDEFINRICYFFDKSRLLTTLLDILAHSPSVADKKRESLLKSADSFDVYRKRCFKRDLNVTQIEKSMLTVSQILHETFDKPVIILIEGYSSLLEDHILEKNYEDYGSAERNAEQMQSFINLMKNFYAKTLFENPYLKKAILTDTLTANKKDLFPDTLHHVHYTSFDNDLHEFYGFTENEVTLLFDHFKIQNDLANRARLFYNGYIMKKNSNVAVYNMESIAQFLNRRLIESSWMMEVNGMSIFRNRWLKRSIGITQWLNFQKFATFLQPLIDEQDVLISYTAVDFDCKELRYFTASGKGKTLNVTKTQVDVVLSMLLEIGFFTNSKPGQGNGDEDGHLRIRIPNQEVRDELRKMTTE